jgi:hypothetical protein
MMVWGVPHDVKTFFAKPVRGSAKPIRGALAAMVLAFLLAPHRRCLKTVAGSVLGHRRHVATISRRLLNPHWKTRDWYKTLYEGLQGKIDRYERRQAKGQRRQWIVAIDTTQCACKCIESAGWKSLSKLGLNFVTESNCVLARGGGEQLEVNGWSAG